MQKQPVNTGKQPRFCHLCGQQLAGRYYQNGEGVVFCASCFANRPHCARCGTPLDDAAIARHRGHAADIPRLCSHCNRTAPRCAACQRPITAISYTFENLDETKPRRYCESCVKSRPRCDACRVPVELGMMPLDDGQYRCASCSTQMVREPRVVENIYQEAVRAFGQVIGVGNPLRQTPRLQIVTRLQMGTIRRSYQQLQQPGSDDSANGHHVLGFFVRYNNVSSIYVERYLPRNMLLGTLAHELGHAWQAEYAPDMHDPLTCEGFAEWVAHRVLVASGLRAAAAHATRRDDIYGRGLRLFLETERKKGLAGVLRLARGEKV